MVHLEETAHVWDPLSPAEAQELFSGLSAPWWISGGWAIDLFIGRQTRPHGDLDVLILRDDQLIFQKHLSHWDLSDRRLPDFTTWSKGDFLDPPINDIWGAPYAGIALGDSTDAYGNRRRFVLRGFPSRTDDHRTNFLSGTDSQIRNTLPLSADSASLQGEQSTD